VVLKRKGGDFYPISAFFWSKPLKDMSPRQLKNFEEFARTNISGDAVTPLPPPKVWYVSFPYNEDLIRKARNLNPGIDLFKRFALLCIVL